MHTGSSKHRGQCHQRPSPLCLCNLGANLIWSVSVCVCETTLTIMWAQHWAWWRLPAHAAAAIVATCYIWNDEILFMLSWQQMLIWSACESTRSIIWDWWYFDLSIQCNAHIGRVATSAHRPHHGTVCGLDLDSRGGPSSLPIFFYVSTSTQLWRIWFFYTFERLTKSAPPPRNPLYESCLFRRLPRLRSVSPTSYF